MTFKKIFFLFFLFLIVFVTLDWFFVIAPIPKANSFFKDIPNIVNEKINIYPQDLVIDVKNGVLTINKPTPYCLVLDEKTKIGIVFDEKSQPTSLINPQTSPYSKLCIPVALVGDTFIVYPDDNSGSIKTQPIPKEANFTIDRENIHLFVQQVLPKLISYGKTAYYVLPFIAGVFLPSTFLARNLWYALIVFLVFKLFRVKKTITYKEAYSKSFVILVAITIFNLVIINLILNQIAKQNLNINFPFLGTILVSIGVILLQKFYFDKIEKEPGQTENTPPSPTTQNSSPTSIK